MKTSPIKRRSKSGFASYLLVLSTAVILTALTVSAYKIAQTAQRTQSSVQLQTDYLEKEDAVLRSIVAITPNRAMLAMMNNSNAASTPLRWQSIFTEALTQANARTSISTELKTTLNITDLKASNVGDSGLANTNLIFRAAKISAANPGAGYVTSGTISDTATLTPLAGFPPILRTNNTTITGTAGDSVYPIISNLKRATGIAVGEESRNFELLNYPNINFGYARPGQPFVAKRNWWAFSMNMSDHDATQTGITRPAREMVLSIYEIPSQLPISASSYMSMGKFATGEKWDKTKVKIDGAIFASRADVEGDQEITGLSSRRRLTLASGTKIGEKSFDHTNPFKPGERERYLIENLGQSDAFPVSLASESGRVAFIPINRGNLFLDRFAHTTESNTLSPTRWNNYSVGALQCRMQLDVVEAPAQTDPNNEQVTFPTKLRFSYMKAGVRVSTPKTYTLSAGLPSNCPFVVKNLPNNKICIAVYPQKFKAYLTSISADGPDINNSLVVNVDYTMANLRPPNVPCTNNDLDDYGLIIEQCKDLTDFTKGFSLVSNLCTYFGDTFNEKEYTTLPATGYSPPPGKHLPPFSMFVPEKRFGVVMNQKTITIDGQIGSLASDTGAAVRPLDSKSMDGTAVNPNGITVNLRPINHPSALPPINMMNWLVVLEERKREFNP